MVLPILVGYALYLIPLVCLTIFLYNRNHRPRAWRNSDSNFDNAFLKHVVTDGFWGGNQEFRTILSKMLSAFRDPTCLGVMVCFEDPTVSKCQMIQFDSVTRIDSVRNSNSNRNSDDKSEYQRCPVLFKGLPMIPVQKWGHATNRDVAMAFLLGYRTNGNKDTDSVTLKDKGKGTTGSCNKVEVIVCCSEDIFRAVFEHLAATCRSNGEVDTTTGCKIYRGHLSPKKV